MNSRTSRVSLHAALVVLCGLALTAWPSAGQAPAPASAAAAAAAKVKTFETAEQAMAALISAAETFDQNAIEQMFGPAGKDLLVTAEPPRDRDIARTFVDLAREKKSVSFDPRNRNHAVILVGSEDWPFAVPLVRRNARWQFDTAAGMQELTYRRVGGDELDAIEICRGFVEAQEEYALQKHDGAEVNQYARRIISTPGKQDGLAWRTPDGKWDGPIGENVANAIDKGYAAGQPYRGYYFKVLMGQGPSAPLGPMDYVVEGAMIGGFALVAAPAEYAVTGVKTFMVGNDGVVYEKDFGDTTLDAFKKMERFNPDSTWTPVQP